MTHGFIIFSPLLFQGECDIVRLLDLSACDSYIKHQNRHAHRGSSAGHITRPSESINLAGYLSPNSPMLKPLLSEGTEEDDDAAISSSISEVNIHSSDAGEVLSTRNRTKSACSRTTRCSEVRSTEQGFSVADLLKRRNTKEIEKSGCPEKRHGTGSEDVGVGVYMVVDKLKPGQLFVSISRRLEKNFIIKIHKIARFQLIKVFEPHYLLHIVVKH